MGTIRILINETDNSMAELYSGKYLMCCVHIDMLADVLAISQYNLLIQEGELKVNMVMI